MADDTLSALRDKRQFVLRLVLGEVLARKGEGPLAPRFGAGATRRRAAPADLPREPERNEP